MSSIKHLFTVLLVIIMLCSSLVVTHAASSGYDATSHWLDSIVGSPLDVSGQVLDAPAGRHGFVKAKDGHFFFEDGKQIKFWGVNLTYQGMFPSHDDADILVDKLAALGFNSVRFHTLDSPVNNGGLIDYKYTDSQHLNLTQFDRLDYLISKLKARGIYISMTVHMSRKFKQDDGVMDYSTISSSTYDLFDDRIIELTKDFATKLFTHTNPYTGLALKDDPTLALVEISNEDNFFDKWVSGALDGKALVGNLTKFYRTELDEKFNFYLKKKYGNQDTLSSVWNKSTNTNNLIKNSDFEQQYSPDWSISTKNNIKLSPVWNAASPYAGKHDVKLSKIRPNYKNGGPFWDEGAFKQKGVKLKEGRTYKLSFNAKFSTAPQATLKVRFEDYQTKSVNGLDQNFELYSKDGWKRYSTTFVAKADTMSIPTGSLAFYFGWVWGDIELDNIELTEVQLKSISAFESLDTATVTRIPWANRYNYSPLRIRDQTEFYYSTLTNTFTNIKLHLQNVVGLKVPVSTSQNYSNNTETMARSVGDYMDGHIYWDHPTFPSKLWDVDNFAQWNTSVIKTAGNTVDSRYWDYTKFLPNAALNKVEGLPFVVGEWSMPFPNDYAFEAAPMITAYAQLQDWDGLFLFAYCGLNCVYGGGDGSVTSWFDMQYNTAILAQMQTSALSLIKGYVKPANTSVVVNYNNADVIDRHITNGALWTFSDDIGRGLPVSLFYKHRFSKAFNAATSSLEGQLLSSEEDQILSAETKHVSDTNEIVWDNSKAGSEYLSVNTPKSQSITGFITNKTLSTSNLKISVTASKYQYGSIALQPLDDTAIVDSKNMLITVISKLYNTGELKNVKHGLSSYGTAPVMMQPLDGKVVLTTNLAGVSDVKVNQLNTNGKIVSEMPATLDFINNKVTVTLRALTSPYLQVVKKSAIN